MEISGKHALVTGAGAGIGRATVIALVQKGAKVVAADINEDGLKETAALAQQAVSGANVVTVKADVSTAAGVRAMFASAMAAFGGLDIVHNNAGLICGEPLWPESLR
jgi:NAD(P)-dependent dehydrogenase (short-subunit alcohol dehydrogenase family)